jgi:hypothetical protein
LGVLYDMLMLFRTAGVTNQRCHFPVGLRRLHIFASALPWIN